MSVGTRGKYAEGQVKKKLASLEAANQAYARWPDARSGSFAVALADFLIMRNGKMTLLEVKEVNHEFRLNYQNFDASQIARMRMWKSAGAQGHVLVYHTPSKFWRAADVSWFFLNYTKTNEVGKAVGSWDLRTIEPITLDDYFGSFL